MTQAALVRYPPRRSPLALLGLLAASLFATGCVVKETKPLPKIAAVQSAQQIPQEELLDVAIHEFDPGLPKDVSDEDALAKRRIYPDVRKAEARMLPATLRATLESSGQWGAVRVVPQSAVDQRAREAVDVGIERAHARRVRPRHARGELRVAAAHERPQRLRVDRVALAEVDRAADVAVEA